MRIVKAIVLGFVCFLGLSNQASLAEDSKELSNLKMMFEELKSDVHAKGSKESALQQQYEKAIGDAIEQAKANADLEGVVALQNELKVYRSRGSDFELSERPNLARLQEIYRTQHKQIRTEIGGELKTLYEGYVRKLTELRDSLTKAGEIDAALEVRDELKKAESEMLLLASGKAGDNLLRPEPTPEPVAEWTELTIKASNEQGVPVGTGKSGSEISLRYKGGKWKGWGRIPTGHPDSLTASAGENNRLAIFGIKTGSEQLERLVVVPAGTAKTPFTYKFEDNYQEVRLRMNDDGDKNWGPNPGSVRYEYKFD